MKTIFFDVRESEKEFFRREIKGDVRFMPGHAKDYDSADIGQIEVISLFTTAAVTKSTLERFKNLRLIIARSVGFSHIDIEYCRARGILVANTPHYGDYTVAEFAFGLLLNLARKIYKSANDLKQGKLGESYSGTELFSKTFGIYGAGAIGGISAKIARGFTDKILACDVVENPELTEKYGVKYVDGNELCAKSDILLLHAPLTKSTRNFLNAERIKLLKSTAFVVNTARGELIDTRALFEALSCKQIAGAALDVIECESLLFSEQYAGEPTENIDCIRKTLLNHALLNLENVIVTPHIAYETDEATERILKITKECYEDFTNGKIPQHIV